MRSRRYAVPCMEYTCVVSLKYNEHVCANTYTQCMLMQSPDAPSDPDHQMPEEDHEEEEEVEEEEEEDKAAGIMQADEGLDDFLRDFIAKAEHVRMAP